MLGAVLLSLAALSPETRFLQRADGRVAYEELGGAGPLVVCVPGIGDVRAQYRLIAPRLVEAGFHVVLMDLRGMGQSTADFADYSAASVGADVAALLRELKAPRAFILGNSMAAAAAVWAAAELPDVVEGVVLLGAFVRDIKGPPFMSLLLKVMFGPPWGPSAWKMYYGTLYPNRKPQDYDAYTTALVGNLREPGRMDALNEMMTASKAAAEARIPQVKSRVLVVMGTDDPDFDPPQKEAEWIASQLQGSVLMVEGAGHYPHVDSVDVVAPAVIRFLQGADHGREGRTDPGVDHPGSGGAGG